MTQVMGTCRNLTKSSTKFLRHVDNMKTQQEQAYSICRS